MRAFVQKIPAQGMLPRLWWPQLAAEHGSANGVVDLDLVLPALVQQGIINGTVVFKREYKLSSDTAATYGTSDFKFQLVPLENYIAGLLGTATPLDLSRKYLEKLKSLIHA